MYDDEKKAWNWEKYIALYIKYHIILGNLMKCGHQDLDPGLDDQYLLNSMRCDKLSTAVAAVRVHTDKYEKVFDAVVASITQYIDKRESGPSVKVASISQTRPANQQKTSTTHGIFKGKIELKKYSSEEYDSMSMRQHQQFYKLWKKVGLIKGKKIPENNRALEARMAMLEVKKDNSRNESLFADEKPKASNPALDGKGRQSCADTWLLELPKEDSQPRVLRDSYVKPLRIICVIVAHALVASSKRKVEFDSHADTCVIGDKCLVIQDSWCCNRVSRSTEWTEVYLNDKSSYSN